MVRSTPNSPFSVTVFSDMTFHGLREFLPKGNQKPLGTQWGDKVPDSAFQLSMNGTKRIQGLPLYKDVLNEIGITDPTDTRWLMGFNDIENPRIFFFCPAVKAYFKEGIPEPYPPGLAKTLKDYALGYPINPLGPEYDKNSKNSLSLSLTTLYIFPHLQHTNVRKRSQSQSYAINVPEIFLEPGIGRVYRRDRRNPASITFDRDLDVSIHLESEKVPYTLLYDVSGNLFFIKHYFYGGTEHVPSIRGVTYTKKTF
jgi:hypothetical protein